MFEQNYGSKDTRWRRWFSGAVALYVVLTLIPQTEGIAAWAGAVAGFSVFVFFRKAISGWVREKLSGR